MIRLGVDHPCSSYSKPMMNESSAYRVYFLSLKNTLPTHKLGLLTQTTEKESKKNTLTCTAIIHPCVLKPSKILLLVEKPQTNQPTNRSGSQSLLTRLSSTRQSTPAAWRGYICGSPIPAPAPAPFPSTLFRFPPRRAPLPSPIFRSKIQISALYLSSPLRPTTSSIPLPPSSPFPPPHHTLNPTAGERSSEPPPIWSAAAPGLAWLGLGRRWPDLWRRIGKQTPKPKPRSATRSGCGGRSRGSPELRGGCGHGSADPGAGHEFLCREGERIAGSRRAPGLRQPAQGLHRLQHHQDAALARRTIRPHVAVQRVRDPVPEEEEGGAGPRRAPQEEAASGSSSRGGGGGVLGGRRRERGAGAAAAQEEDDDDQEGARGGAPRCRVRQGGGSEAAAADAAQPAPGRGGEGGHPPHGPLLRRHLRLTQPHPPS